MTAVIQLQRQFIEYATSLYNEGYLDDQFTQLQKLQDESNPEFVVEVVSLFFEDSEKLLNNLATALQQKTVDYKQVDSHVHQFKGSSSSIGAHRVTSVCIIFRNYCEEKNLDGIARNKNAHNVYVNFILEEVDVLLKLERFPFLGHPTNYFHFFDFPQIARCLRCLQQLKHEYVIVKNKLEALFTLERQILQAGGSVPVME